MLGSRFDCLKQSISAWFDPRATELHIVSGVIPHPPTLSAPCGASNDKFPRGGGAFPAFTPRYCKLISAHEMAWAFLHRYSAHLSSTPSAHNKPPRWNDGRSRQALPRKRLLVVIWPCLTLRLTKKEDWPGTYYAQNGWDVASYSAEVYPGALSMESPGIETVRNTEARKGFAI